MKFSAQEEYGLRCLLQVARRGASATIPQIAAAEGMSTTHVAKLLMLLRREGWVDSTRGQAGGYTLAKAPEEILVKNVLNSLGGQLYDEEFCVRHSGQLDICKHAVDCSVRSLWQKMQAAIDQVLEGVTLADLFEEVEATNVTFFSERPVPDRAMAGLP